jgi:CubicO group peptidase (beta-lactamase class C family)
MKNSFLLPAALLLLVINSACQQTSTSNANVNSPEVIDQRATWTTTLFTGVEQFEHFNRLAEIFPHHTMNASTTPYRIPVGDKLVLPSTHSYAGKVQDSDKFLRETDTVAMLVIEKGKLRYENYWLTGGEDVNWMSMSVGKSFVSAMVGIALEEGLINSVEDPITRYVPDLSGSAYDEVRIKDILQMSSGARWNEDYSDPDSDIMRYAQAFGSGGSLDAFTATLVREREPGTFNYYNSTDTQALGMLLVNVTGKPLADYAEEKLWQPLGMQDSAYWITDDAGMEMAAGGLQVTARDYAKLGLLYLNNGNWNGVQIVPEDWVHDSVTPDAPHVMPGVHEDFPLGYGYQWWLPESDEGEYAAIGVYNQFIYVNPTRNLVIVKLSANNAYGTTNTEASYRELESIELFREIGRSLSDHH